MSFWTEENTKLLIKYWMNQKLTGTQISRMFGGQVSRNAVVGKIHRLGLNGRGDVRSPKQKSQAGRKKWPKSPGP